MKYNIVSDSEIRSCVQFSGLTGLRIVPAITYHQTKNENRTCIYSRCTHIACKSLAICIPSALEPWYNRLIMSYDSRHPIQRGMQMPERKTIAFVQKFRLQFQESKDCNCLAVIEVISKDKIN